MNEVCEVKMPLNTFSCKNSVFVATYTSGKSIGTGWTIDLPQEEERSPGGIPLQ